MSMQAEARLRAELVVAMLGASWHGAVCGDLQVAAMLSALPVSHRPVAWIALRNSELRGNHELDALANKSGSRLNTLPVSEECLQKAEGNAASNIIIIIINSDLYFCEADIARERSASSI